MLADFISIFIALNIQKRANIQVSVLIDLPHVQTKLLKEPDEEGEPQLQEGHDVVRLKLLVLFGQLASEAYQFWISDGVPVSCDHAAYDVGNEHVELPVQALREFGFVTFSYA